MERRDFLKAAGTTAGVALAAGYSPFSYAKNEKVSVASIGVGGQGSFHVRDGIAGSGNLDLIAVCDVYKPHLNNAWKQAGGETREVKKYMDYRKMLDELDVDAIVIATPLHTHHQIAMDCLDAGKWIFCEKTLCYEIEHCRDIVKKCNEVGKFCQVGHQRRYNPKYNKAVWLAREPGLLGRINHLTAQWHRNNDWRRPVDLNYQLSSEEKRWIKDLEKHINWRLYRESSGGLVTELATHQVDIFQWFMGKPPARVSGYGGIDYWRDGREVYDNIALMYEYDLEPGDAGYTALAPRTERQRRTQLNKPYTVRATYSSVTANGKLGASELIQGDHAAFELTEKDCFIFGEPQIRMEKERDAKKKSAKEAAADITEGKTLGLPNDAYKNGSPIRVFSERSVDQLQFEAFGNDIKNGGTPKANQMVGLYTAIAGLSGLKAMRDGGGEVKIDPALYAFDFETPDPYQYENWAGPDDPEGGEQGRKV